MKTKFSQLLTFISGKSRYRIIEIVSRRFNAIITSIQPFFFCCPGRSISWYSRKKSGFLNSVFCPGYISLVNIVASPSCTEYHWGTLIAFY